MFGGLSFMVDGTLAVSVRSTGDLLVRCDPCRVEDLLGRPGVDWAQMKGKRMGRGWLAIGSTYVASQADLCFWVGVALERPGRERIVRDGSAADGRPGA